METTEKLKKIEEYQEKLSKISNVLEYVSNNKDEIMSVIRDNVGLNNTKTTSNLYPGILDLIEKDIKKLKYEGDKLFK